MTRVVVTGGAGFLGSHLCERLLDEGASVVAIDNLATGSEGNIEHLFGHDGFRFVKYDVTDYLHVPGEVDHILHFASPASPIDYLELPIQTLKVGSLGTHKALGLAKAKGSRLLLASTSEVYGDPQVHPQPETYWGHVNPIGPRGVYDEAKRFAEALTFAYHRAHGVDTRVVRIFNSVLADELVVYDDGESLRVETAEAASSRLGIGDIEGVSVPAFDDEGRISASPAIAYVGHPTGQRCYEVILRYGRSIRVTGDHSLFVRDGDGRPTALPVNEMAVGQHVAIAGKIAVLERDRVSLDLVHLWDRSGRDDWDLFVSSPGLGADVWERRQEAISLLVTKFGGTRQSRYGTLVRGRDSDEAPLGLLRRLGIAIPRDAVVRPRRGRSPLPRELTITDEFLWFLGLYVAEGHRRSDDHDSFVTLSCDLPTLDRARKILNEEFGLHSVEAPASDARAAAIFVHSRFFVDILDWLEFPSSEKGIPGWVLGLPLERLGHFLDGYREGDGVHSGKKFDEAVRHEFSTTSARLKDDLIVAIGRFGLVPSVGRYESTLRQKTGDRRYPFWRLTLANVSPWSPLEWAGGVTQKLNAARYGDLVWSQVKEIREVPASPLVYDFCVPGRENFLAGGAVMAHNTFGPRMRLDDGRAVPTFIRQSLQGEELTVHGDGSQTRSLCYVDDLVEGILRLLVSDYTDPCNIGNPHELTMRELAETIQDVVGEHPGITYTPRPTDDPEVRQPDTTVAERELGWKPKVDLREGLERTVAWARTQV